MIFFCLALLYCSYITSYAVLARPFVLFVVFFPSISHVDEVSAHVAFSSLFPPLDVHEFVSFFLHFFALI